MSSSARRRSRPDPGPAAAMMVAVAWLAGATSACYFYPAGVDDPCVGRRCSYGAQCRASLDGLTARCQCSDRCDRYGDTVDAGERCGDDGLDYESECEMRLAACRQMREIRAKFLGRCGQQPEFIIQYYIIMQMVHNS